MRLLPRAVFAVTAALSGIAAPAVHAQDPAWKVSKGELRVVCPLTVGGSFEAQSTGLSGTMTLSTVRPTTFRGGIHLDLASIDTGIALRNQHLREQYLEVSKGEGYAQAVLSGLSLGNLDPRTFQGRTPFAATLLLHGVRKTVNASAEVRREPDGIRVSSTFPLKLSDYGVAQPQYLGVGVGDTLQVRIQLTLVPAGGK